MKIILHLFTSDLWNVGFALGSSFVPDTDHDPNHEELIAIKIAINHRLSWSLKQSTDFRSK